MSFLRRLYYALPPRLRFAARRLWYAPLDAWERISGKRDPLTPPRGLIFTGGGDFRAQGLRTVEICRQYAGLEPQHRILDVGSGIGRLAVALTSFLNEQGSYEGFDVVSRGVKWCRRQVTGRFPNFRFQYVPLANDLYRSDGLSARGFTFPYPDTDFDTVCVISVFTHMLPGEVVQYLREIRRVLRPGGRCCCTFFIVNDDAQATAVPDFSFPHDHGHYLLMDERVKAANVAYREDWLRAQVQAAGLRLETLQYGYWCGRSRKMDDYFQDILVLQAL